MVEEEEEEEEVVTAWRVVKRRTAKGAVGETRDATVYASRVGRGTPRGLTGGKGWLERRVADQAEVGRLLSLVVSSSLSLSSLPRIFFAPASIPVSLALLPLFPSQRLRFPSLSLSLSLTFSFSPLRCVCAVNGQAWSTDLRMACSCLLPALGSLTSLTPRFVSSVSLPFRTDLFLFLRRLLWHVLLAALPAKGSSLS